MPLYEYECAAGHRFELIRKFADPPLEKCPTCGEPVHKLFSSPAIQFKGSGFYITDYAKKEQTPASPGGESKPETASKEKDTGEKREEKAGEKAEKTQKAEKSEKTEKSDRSEKGSKDEKSSTKADSTPASPSKPAAAKDGT
jgi:putative FmdB family regulatory protein